MVGGGEEKFVLFLFSGVVRWVGFLLVRGYLAGNTGVITGAYSSPRISGGKNAPLLFHPLGFGRERENVGVTRLGQAVRLLEMRQPPHVQSLKFL